MDLMPRYLVINANAVAATPLEAADQKQNSTTASTAATSPEPNNIYTVKVDIGRVREAPSLQSPVALRLIKGEQVKVTAVKAEWFEIELKDGRRGWAAQRLFVKGVPAEVTAKAFKEIKKISFVKGSAGEEKIRIALNGNFPPRSFVIEGARLRLVCDFPETRLSPGVGPRVEAAGQMVADIRLAQHTRPQFKTRLVVDLAPKIRYQVEQFFYQKEKVFELIIKQRF
jgi:SH3-like domain-containing protein